MKYKPFNICNAGAAKNSLIEIIVQSGCDSLTKNAPKGTRTPDTI